MERPAREDWTEDEAMSGDRVKQTTVQWLEEGRAEGLVEGRSRDRQRQIDIMRRQAARKFDDTTAERLAVQLQRIADPEQMGEVGEWLIECEDARELCDRVEGLTGRWFSSSVAASRTASAPPRL